MLKNCASLSTIVLLNVINELAKCTKEGVIPLSKIKSEDDADKYLHSYIIYDDNEKFFKDDNEDSPFNDSYRIVGGFDYNDNDRPIPNLYYDEMFEGIEIFFWPYDSMVICEELSSGAEVQCKDGEWYLFACFGVDNSIYPIDNSVYLV